MKPPRFAALDRVIQSRLPHSVRTVYTAIHIRCSENGYCDFDQQDFATDIHVPRRTLQRAIARLSSAGNLIVKPTKTINRYFLPWSKALVEMRIPAQSEGDYSAPEVAQSESYTAPLCAPIVAQSGTGHTHDVSYDESNKKKDDVCRPQRHHLLFRCIAGKEPNRDDAELISAITRKHPPEVVTAGMLITGIRATATGSSPRSFRYFLPEIEKTAQTLPGIKDNPTYLAYLASKWDRVRARAS